MKTQIERRSAPSADEEVPERDLARDVITGLEQICEMYEAVCQDLEASKAEGLPDELKKRLASVAKKRGTTKEALAKTLLEKGLDELERKKLLSDGEENEEDALDI
jgi:predicted DNA-binding protein